MRQSKEQNNASEDRPKLNALNWLNLVSYLSNFAITYGVGVLGWFGNGTNDELSEKYQALVTPKSTAFLIWTLIFTLQAIFIVLQMLAKFRAKPMVQKGVKYWFILVSLFQILWTIVFSFEIIWLALVFIVLLWLSLVGLVYSQYYTTSEGTIVEFLFLRFPFALHCGWLTAASVLNANVLAVDLNSSAENQLAIGIVSLAYLHAVSVWVLFGFARPNYTIAGVLAWAFGWIYAELQDPKTLILDTFDADIIAGVSKASLLVAFIILGQMVVRFLYFIYRRFIDGADKDSSNDEDNDKV
jgi:hypothetical protein